MLVLSPTCRPDEPDSPDLTDSQPTSPDSFQITQLRVMTVQVGAVLGFLVIRRTGSLPGADNSPRTLLPKSGISPMLDPVGLGPLAQIAFHTWRRKGLSPDLLQALWKIDQPRAPRDLKRRRSQPDLPSSLAAPSCPSDLARIAHPDRRPLVSLVIGDDNEAHSPPCEGRQHSAELGPRQLLIVDLDHRFALIVSAAIVDRATQDIASCAPLAREIRPLDLRLLDGNLDRDVLVVAPILVHGRDGLVEPFENLRVGHVLQRGADLEMRGADVGGGVLDHGGLAVGLTRDPNLVRRSDVTKAAHRGCLPRGLSTCRPDHRTRDASAG